MLKVGDFDICSEPFFWLWSDGCRGNGQIGQKVENGTTAAQM